MCIARRYARLGRTIASALAVAGAGGVTLTFLVASPNLRADQWLAILLSLQFLRTAMWACVWMAARQLQLRTLIPFSSVVSSPGSLRTLSCSACSKACIRSRRRRRRQRSLSPRALTAALRSRRALCQLYRRAPEGAASTVAILGERRHTHYAHQRALQRFVRRLCRRRAGARGRGGARARQRARRAGTLTLLRDGAHPVGCTRDVLEPLPARSDRGYRSSVRAIG